jgi:hypothetical protein
MVDRSARDCLAQLVRHLATGIMSKEEFSTKAGNLAENSCDPGVWAVYATADALHDDVSAIWPVRFRGWMRLAPDVRRRLAVTALFLYSQAEYEWPNTPAPSGGCLDALLLCACAIFGLAGLLLLGVSFVAPWWCAIISRICLAMSVWLYVLSQRLAARFRAEWEEAQRQLGDYEVWPFRWWADFDEARRHPRLLCGRLAQAQGRV